MPVITAPYILVPITSPPYRFILQYKHIQQALNPEHQRGSNRLAFAALNKVGQLGKLIYIFFFK